MFRKFYFLFILLFSFTFCLTNTFGDENGDPINIEDIIAGGNFAFPTAEGPAYIQGNAEFQRVPEHVFGSNDIEKMRDVPTNSQDYQLSRQVGMIFTLNRDRDAIKACTGFLVGPDLFMTTYQCIHDEQGILPLGTTTTAIYMDYYQDPDVDPTRGGIQARVSSVVRMDATKDYALLRLNLRIGNTYGWLELDSTTRTNPNQSVKLISHNKVRSKEIVRRNSQIVFVPPTLSEEYPHLVAYLADTELGSSGSPVFLREGTGVIAINYSSWSNKATGEPVFNGGSLMSHIVPEIRQYLPTGPPNLDVPDLIVEAFQVSKTTVPSNESFTLSATVKNQGLAPSTATQLTFWEYTGTSEAVLKRFNVGPLNPDQTSTFEITHRVSRTGTYRYQAVVDTVTDETATHNNQSAQVTVTITDAPAAPELPDLAVVAAPVAINDQLLPGESFTLSATVSNQGDAASTATTLRFYQSTDTTITTNDTEIGAVNVDPLQPDGTATVTFTNNAPMTVGMYNYGVCVDPVATETATHNNCSPSVTVTVTDTPPVYMYWVDSGTDKIQRANLDGSRVQSIVTTGLKTPTSIAVNFLNGKMYWIDSGTDKIQSADLNGSTIEDIVTTGLRTPTDIEIDYEFDLLYWIDSGTDKIQGTHNHGTTIDDLVTTGLRTPKGIALDLLERKMYWIDSGTDKIQRANLNGTTIEDIVTTGLETPADIEVDMENRKIYWIDAGTDKIQRANLDGSNIEDIVTTGLRTPTSIALDLTEDTGDKIYWIDSGTDKIQRANLDGSNIEDLVTTGLQTPTGIALGIPQVVPTRPPGPGPGDNAADVNRDGQVTVVDLAIVAIFYGTQVPTGGTLRADVNADGRVNIPDLIAVAEAVDAAGNAGVLPPDAIAGVLEDIAAEINALEAAAEAPAHFSLNRPDWVTHPLRAGAAYQNVAKAFADAKHIVTDDAQLQKWMPVLKELLLMLTEMQHIPETTALLPNYPNPFNPETWIPYHLAQAADVTVTIHDVRGSVVRKLTLGHQPAGVYENRGRAAYWDGRNEVGEPVASGLYFYTLSTESTRDSVTAGEFTATRKLLIAK